MTRVGIPVGRDLVVFPGEGEAILEQDRDEIYVPAEKLDDLIAALMQAKAILDGMEVITGEGQEEGRHAQRQGEGQVLTPPPERPRDPWGLLGLVLVALIGWAAFTAHCLWERAHGR